MMNQKTKRILGFDFARGLAIVGMVFVNFKVVMVAETEGFLYQLVELLSGKAAALFVVLAGIGMTLMYKSARKKNDPAKVRQTQYSLLKRAAFLFVVGLSYYVIWPADILHYYGVYMTIGVLFLSAPSWLIQLVSALLILGYSILLLFINYEAGWDFSTLEYVGFFTAEGFFRNLFLNGFHPVFPWLAFLLIGIWIGRIDFNNDKARKKVAITSLLVYLIFKGISIAGVEWARAALPAQDAEELYYFLGTSPMPPAFFYMITASSLAVFIIAVSVWVGQKYAQTMVVKQIVSAGQLALSNYFFHVVIGMFGVQLLLGQLEQAYSMEFVFLYALLFNVLLLLFSYYWRKKFKRGPLEWVMRRVTA
jgi:uncharacterized protein